MRQKDGSNLTLPCDDLFDSEQFIQTPYAYRRSSATNARPAEAHAGETDQDYIAATSRGRICLDTLVSLDKENELEDILQIIRKRETFVSHLKEGWDKQAGIRRGTSRHMDQNLDSLIDFGVLSRTSASPQEVILHAFTVEKKSGSLRFVGGRKLKRSRGPPPQMSKKTITFNSSLFFGVNTAGDRRMTWVAYQFNKR